MQLPKWRLGPPIGQYLGPRFPAYDPAMRSPPITIACECGELRHIAYGETWTCETCGRRWNTEQIPAEEYWGLLRELRRERLVVIGIAAALAVVFAGLAVFVSEALFLLFRLVLGFWFMWYMPMWRRRVRRRARSSPKWELHPE